MFKAQLRRSRVALLAPGISCQAWLLMEMHKVGHVIAVQKT